MNLSIGGIGIEIRSQEVEIVYDKVSKFLSNGSADVVVEVEVRKQEEKIELPVYGEDLFCLYYGSQAEWIRLKGASGEASAAIACENGIYELRFFVYPQLQISKMKAESLLSFLPFRRILYAFDAFLLHSSRIQVCNRGILFSGASGVGKTTQAMLWEKYENTRILCNDRTVLRKVEGIWNTYGYFQDGSMPISDNTCIPLGAIVFLQQGKSNRICRVNYIKAFKMLIGQISVDNWDYKMIAGITELILNLLEGVPVYSMQCVPDQSAVIFLKNTLVQEGVLQNEQ